MRTTRQTTLLATILTLATAATALLLADLPAQSAADERAEVFQHLVGGLGFGPALDLSRCPFSFDPRLACACQEDHGPIPGGAWFCPHHASSILAYPSLRCQTQRD